MPERNPPVLSLNTRAAASSALSNPDLDLDLRALLGLRLWQLHIEQGLFFGSGFRLVVVQGGDTPEVINEALGFAITGPDAKEPAYDRIEDHGLWFEITYVTAAGLPVHVFVENGPGTELGIHYLCLAHFWRRGDEDKA